MDASPPDAGSLLADLEQNYHAHAASPALSPVKRLRNIADLATDNKFRTYALLVAEQFAAHAKLSELDTIFHGPETIKTGDKGWVANSSMLTRNAIR